MKKILKKCSIAIFFISLSLIANLYVLLHPGIPFRYDWVWPAFNSNVPWSSILVVDSGILSVVSRNMQLIFLIINSIVFNTTIFFGLWLVLITYISGFGAYKFLSGQKANKTIAIIFGIIYSLSPYIFIRTIVGYRWSMSAYALLPIFLSLYFNCNKKKPYHFILLGLLMSLIFAQIQAGLLLSLILFVNLIISLFMLENRRETIKSFILTYIYFVLFNLPWYLCFKMHHVSVAAVSGSAATTLGYIASVPHSLRNMLMLSDHQITSGYFYILSHDKLFLIGWLIVWFVAICSIFNKKRRQLVLTFGLPCLLVFPFLKGPVGKFGQFYTWFYGLVPQIAVFRETYHFEFLYAISLCVLFAFGLEWLWQKIDSSKIAVGSRQPAAHKDKKTANSQLLTANIIRTALKALFAGSAIFIIAPYLTLDYAGYLPTQKIPTEYDNLYKYLQQNKNYCKKIYYPPGLGFVYFKGDRSAAAANSDIIANSMGVPYLDDGTTYSYIYDESRYQRNELVSQFYEKGADTGQFASLLEEANVDCVVLRLDTETKFNEATNLWRETDPAVVKKWNNVHLKELIESKQGLYLDKNFGDNIWIYKINNQDTSNNNQLNSNFQNQKLTQTGKSAAEEFETVNTLHPTTYTLPLTDWANNYAYYKDGWSRGRYDFWRKHLFTQLRQDFVYTDKQDSTFSGKITQNGSYELWARYLDGGTAGKVEINIQNTIFNIQKDPGSEKFIWKKLGDIKVDGQANIEIKNISGENAIADMVLVQR